MSDASDTKIQGVLVGIVSNNKDPDKQGRVTLKFPLHEKEIESDWAPIATMMAGKDRGTLFIPEVGDQVLVAFLMGDISKPFVIGALWNSVDTALVGDDKNNIRKIKSRSGHELIFDDKDGDEKIIIKTKKGHIIQITDKNDTIKIADSTGNNMLQLEGGSKNKVTLKSNTSELLLDGKGDITIKSAKSLKLESAQISITAKGQLSIKGAMVDIKSDGMLNIKGSMVKIN
ncbi:MAG: phage baseplate assembly protein V [Paenibacillaceae bacterium]